MKAAEILENTAKGGIIKSITVDDLVSATKGSKISSEVARNVSDILQTNGSSNLYQKTVTRNLSPGIVFQTEAEKVGSFFDPVLVLNETKLGGKTVEEIDEMFRAARNTVANGLNDGIVHESYHAKLMQNMNYAEVERGETDGIPYETLELFERFLVKYD